MYLEDDGLSAPIYNTGKASWETLYVAPKGTTSGLCCPHNATSLEYHEETNGKHHYPGLQRTLLSSGLGWL